MKKILFLCTQNKLRSKTAETIFSERADMDVKSAGLALDATVTVTGDLLNWADIVFVMEPEHKKKLCKKFKAEMAGKKLFMLGIPDEYDFMDDELIRLLKGRVLKFF